MKLITEYPAIEIKSEFIALVSKIEITGEDEFKVDFNSPELMWGKVILPILIRNMCGECTGSGIMAGNEPCKRCMGTGKLDPQRDRMYSSLMTGFVKIKQDQSEALKLVESLEKEFHTLQLLKTKYEEQVTKLETQQDQSKCELLQACQAAYRLLQNEGKENSIIGTQIKMTIENANKE